MQEKLSIAEKRNRRKANLTGLAFSSPWIIGFLVFSLYPIAISLYYSFTNFNVFNPPTFIGMQNYKSLFNDDLFYKSLYNTFYMTVIGTPVNIIIGLITALLLNMKAKGMKIFRTIYYLPSIVPAVASALLWMWLLNAQYGLINNILGALHLYQPNWLTSGPYTKPALILMGAWTTGPTMIIFLAALQGVPQQLYEAAEMDGANTWEKFWHVTLPAISPIVLYQIILSVINNFQYFTQAYIMTGTGNGQYTGTVGGPDNSMLFYALYLYTVGFDFLKMGKACAMAWILFIIVAVVTVLLIKTSNMWVDYGEGGDSQ